MPKTKNKKKNKNISEKEAEGAREEKNIRTEDQETLLNTEPIVFSWETADFVKKPLTEFYFTLAALGAMAMILWGVYSKNFIMAATFIILVVLIIIVLNEEPRKMKVRISEQGIDIDKEHYKFSEFRSFKIAEAEGLPALILKHRKSLSLFRTIYIENEPASDLENFLEIFLEKEE